MSNKFGHKMPHLWWTAAAIGFFILVTIVLFIKAYIAAHSN
jgi:hypothetical protein